MRSFIAVFLSLVYSGITFASTSPTISESQKLLASDGGLYSQFGRSISIQGNTALISAYFDGPLNQGAVYAFEKDSQGLWHEKQKFSSQGLVEAAAFGADISLLGDYAVVGAYQQQSGPGLNGAAYLFRRDASGVWSRVAGLATGEARRFFGQGVAMGDGFAAVSSTFSPTTPEAVYLFSPNSSGIWVRSDKLTLVEPQGATRFGHDIAVSANSLLVGAPLDNERGTHAGAAYIFEPQGAKWTETAKLVCVDGQSDDQFGDSVALFGNIALVGAPGSNSAYLFRKSIEGAWHQFAKLSPDDVTPASSVGESVALWNNYALVGDGPDEGVGGAYLFQFDQFGNWSQVAKYVASDGEIGNGFGWAVGMDAGSIIVGATGDEDLATISGAAYAFHVVPEPSAIVLAASWISLAFGLRPRVRSGRSIKSHDDCNGERI